MAKQSKTLPLRIGIFVCIMAAILFGMHIVNRAAATSTKYVPLAQCLAKKDVKLYGAFWCTHCADQKSEFGAGAQYLPYVECSNVDHSQNETCDRAGIQNRYPTWVFADGTHHEGGMTPKELSVTTGCTLPETGNDTQSTLSKTPCVNDGTPCKVE